MRYSLSELESLALAAGFSGDDATRASAVAMAESGGDPDANGDPHNPSDPTNPYSSKSFGLWQIDTAFHPGSKATLTPADANAQAAFTIWKQAGGNFHPWSTAWEDPVKRLGYFGPKAPASKYLNAPPPKPPIPSGGVLGPVAGLLILGGVTYLIVKKG